jgi:hypothetical protein
LSRDTNEFSVSVHILVALLFVPGRTKDKNEVNHIDENKLNFNFQNLEWTTHSENLKHSSYKWSKPVKKICLETGKVLAVYNSRVEAALTFDSNSNSKIGRVIKGQQKSAFGYSWQNVTEEELSQFPELECNKRRQKLLLLEETK